jgi:septum formation protein
MALLPKIILASTSPRRVDLLKQVGLPFQCVSPTADETPQKGEKPEALVKRLAFAKASSVAKDTKDACLIIAADTIVVSPNGKNILGKPKDIGDAKKMLRSLGGKTHVVLTGYCILSRDPQGREAKKIRMVKSYVTLRKLTSHEIETYVASGEPMDKAGSYAAQGIGMAIVESLRGSYTNVVGLPMAQLIADLEHMTGASFLSWIQSDFKKSK